MEIFKLFESTIPDVEPGHINTKDLRRDQLLENFDTATKTLHALIKAKENEIAYRRDLLDMLEKSKTIYDNKLVRASQAYHVAKKHAVDSSNKNKHSLTPPSTTPPLPPPPVTITTTTTTITSTATAAQQTPIATGSQSSIKNSDLDIPLPSESAENRSSLDRRLSEFLKTFPNLTQAGLAPASNNNNVKPLPGYYTQQPPPPPPISAAPPLMAMMRFPPPPLIPPAANANIHLVSQENHDTADMELSDYDESSNNGGSSTVSGSLIPMVASAMQQGAGGKQHLRAESQQTYVAGQQFNNPIQYAPRINPLPFDPSIMEPRLRDSPSSSGSRDKHSHSDRGGSHRHSSSSGGSSTGGKQSSDKNKYSSASSHSSSRSKRR